MGQGIHTGSCCQSLGHGRHHLRINHCHYRDIMGIHAYEFTLFLHIRDHVVNGNFRRGACCGGNCNNWHTRILGRSNAFQTSHIFKFRVGDDNADCLGGIHGGTAANGNDIVGSGCLESRNAGLYVLDGRVRFDIGINLVGQSCILQYLCHLAGYIELNQVRVGTYKSLLKSPCLCLICNLLDCTCAVIGCLV